ncbi:hypothetical protein [Nocardia mangyaensis]|uniref:hypothetical protein n=1 Tax=Nocardia mangyaensis TaxID=2213200 RepID=UPI0012EC9020|nr:hypothetical protein [Nocardia mangyaensis]
MSATLGVEPEQLTVMARMWRQAGDEVGGLAWSTMSEATGDGSEVLAAVRALTDPAQRGLARLLGIGMGHPAVECYRTERAVLLVQYTGGFPAQPARRVG